MNTKSPPSIPELICRLFFCRLVVFGSLSPSLSLSNREREIDGLTTKHASNTYTCNETL